MQTRVILMTDQLPFQAGNVQYNHIFIKQLEILLEKMVSYQRYYQSFFLEDLVFSSSIKLDQLAGVRGYAFEPRISPISDIISTLCMHGSLYGVAHDRPWLMTTRKSLFLCGRLVTDSSVMDDTCQNLKVKQRSLQLILIQRSTHMLLPKIQTPSFQTFSFSYYHMLFLIICRFMYY